MAKHIHTSTLKLFESIIGPTTTSLAKKKARLVFCQLDEQLQVKANPYPKSYHAEKPPITLINHANVFAQQGLDIGSRFLMEHMPSSPDVKTILDLGCGNGVLGITAAFHNPQAKLIFTDESFMAVASAQTNFTNALPGRDGEFICTDCLESIEDNSIDLILNNPPFHQQHTVGDHIAWQMFLQSKSRLKPRGELWVIGNRHLGYHIKLKRLFGNCTTVASNSKFVILKSIKHHSSR